MSPETRVVLSSRTSEQLILNHANAGLESDDMIGMQISCPVLSVGVERVYEVIGRVQENPPVIWITRNTTIESFCLELARVAGETLEEGYFVHGVETFAREIGNRLDSPHWIIVAAVDGVSFDEYISNRILHHLVGEAARPSNLKVAVVAERPLSKSWHSKENCPTIDLNPYSRIEVGQYLKSRDIRYTEEEVGRFYTYTAGLPGIIQHLTFEGVPEDINDLMSLEDQQLDPLREVYDRIILRFSEELQSHSIDLEISEIENVLAAIALVERPMSIREIRNNIIPFLVEKGLLSGTQRDMILLKLLRTLGISISDDSGMYIPGVVADLYPLDPTIAQEIKRLEWE